MRLPGPRGEISDLLVRALRLSPRDLPGLLPRLPSPDDVVTDEDLQLALHICYELHYRGWDGVDDGWEWQPSLLALRGAVEDRFTAGLRRLTATVAPDGQPGSAAPDDVADALAGLVNRADDGPPLSRYLERTATLAQFREFVVHRSIYHLKEADPHTWAVPRLHGAAKAALVEIQFDEYGGGRPDRMHAELFRTTMASLDLDDRYGAYVDAVPGLTLAASNVMSLFGLHRRHRGAILGHLAAFEMTSSVPNRSYGNGLRRLGGSAAATRFYDEHVEADAVHEQIAVHDMCVRFCRDEPRSTDAVLFGAACALAVDALLATHLLSCWEQGHSSLRAVPEPALAG